LKDGPDNAGEGLTEAVEAPAPATTGTDSDDKVLALREQGRSFANIARSLGLDGALQANAAFNRALRRQPAAEQESVRSHEMARLDALGERLRTREDLNEVEVARRMRNLERLKKTLLAS